MQFTFSTSTSQRAQEEQKEKYDAKHNTKTNIKVGDEVLVRNMKNTHRMGGKLDIRWTGPYEVVEDCGKMRYKLKSRKGGNILKISVHCSRLKYYTHPAGEEQDEEKEGDMGEEREAEGNEHEEGDEGNKKKVCDSYSSISILDVCDITCTVLHSILAYYNLDQRMYSADIIQFCVHAEEKESHRISCSRKSKKAACKEEETELSDSCSM